MPNNDQEHIDISVVVPVRNEEKNIPELTRRLRETLSGMGLVFEVIFVTDENTDRTVDTLKAQHAEDPRIKMVKLARGRGQHMAVIAGLAASQGEYVVMMDGDLQDDPDDIPKLYAKLQEGYHAVFGKKEKKNETAIRNFFSRSFVGVMNFLSDTPMSVNTALFRIITRHLADELLRFTEYDQDPTLLITLIGLPETSIPVRSGQRFDGETNYTFWRQLNIAIADLIVFSTKPLRLIAAFGFLCAGLSFLHFLYVIAQWFRGVDVPGWTTLAVLVSFLGSAQLISLGVIGEYLAHVFMESKRRPLYVVEERCGTLKSGITRPSN